jgi:hypothetical protein
MNIRLEFWKNSIGWPRDNSSYVFLARAVHAIGKTMFGAEWTGEEPYLDLKQSLPALPLTSGSRAYFAHDLLLKHHPEFGRQPLKWSRGPFGSMPPSVKFTGLEWEAARAIVAKDHEQKMPGVRRFSQVKNKIIQLAEAGLLITAIREKAGGDPTPIPRVWWNSERIHNRFDLCQLNPNDPYGQGSAGDRYQWIFVTRESLMSCAGESGEDAKQRSDGPITPSEAARTEAEECDKGGRPLEYDWEAVKEYALGLVKQYGAPGRSNRRLPSKAQLAEAILNEWASKGIQLAEPTVRRYICNWLKEL